MNKIHHVEALHFTDNSLILNVDGREYTFLLSDISPKLSRASATERSAYRIMASGYGIHWPLLDEDLSVDGLLGVVHAPQTSGAKGRQYPQAA
jgi:hypothetical protein